MEFIIFLIIVGFVIKRSKEKVQVESNQKQNINKNNSAFNNNSVNNTTGNKAGKYTTTTTMGTVNNQSTTRTVSRTTSVSSNSKYDNNMTMYASKNNDDNKNRAKDYENCFKTYKYTEIRDIAALLNVSESRVIKDIKKYQQMGYFKDIKVDIKNRQIIYNSANTVALNKKSQTVDEDRYKYINKEPNATYNYVNKDYKEDYNYVNKTRKEDYNYVNKQQKEDYTYINKKKAEYNADKEYVRKQHELHTEEDKHWEKDSVEEEAINLDVEFGTFSSYDFNSFDFIPSFNSFDYLPGIYDELDIEKMIEEV